ncbi:hypothetical protein P3X46_008407 [Hevea brasiliensis]|uniref:Pseudouridylate synthase PUS7L N-terminal domain-containing protein n=1 Tax=Hevea brasiliensis TaxID=3981 RepID=A0ABQ9ML74_HEVBR|nr:hypothetical protein P3X46_008407 [Hevea brasiliensis]
MATAKMTTDESDVGIFCYISQLPGFRGILKQRYSDFIVNEVDKDGNVVHLTSLEVPSQIVEAVEEGEKKVSIQIGKSYASEIESFRSLAGDSDAERLEAFITQVTTESEDCRSISPILLSPNSDKANRTAMHNFFKEKFKFLVTDTVDGPDASLKCIRVRLKSGGHNNGGRNSKKRKDRGGQPFDCRGSDQIVVGDLVYFKGDDTERETLGVNSECEVHSHDDVHDCSNSDETSGANLPEMKNTLVKAVTAEDISTGNYTIDDVILPMPGSRVSYPMNDVAKVYHDLAKKDTINLAESVHSVKEFSITSITGNYRRVFQKPTDFEWELLSYTDGNIPLAVTDLDKIAKVKSKNLFKEEERANGKEDKNPYCTRQPMSFQNDIHLSTDYNETEGEREVVLAQVNSVCDSYSQGTQMALKLSFTLPASSYATIAIRELLKTSSVALHKTLNQ